MHANEFDSMLGETYDSVTGQELPEAVEKRQDLAEDRVIEEGQKLADLSKHPGWLIVKRIMEETIRQECEALLYGANMDFILKLQAQVKARKELLSWLDMKMLEAKTLLEEAKSLAP